MTRTALFVQEACYAHRYIRSRDDSAIVERPERLRSLALGLAAAIARLEEIGATPGNTNNTIKEALVRVKPEPDNEADELTNALGKLAIDSSPKTPFLHTDAIRIVNSAARLKILNDPAVKFIHGDIDGPGYIDNFVTWASESANKVAQGSSEIPEGLHQGDLYLCPQTHDAVAGALGTVCEAIDAVILGASPPRTSLHSGKQPSEESSASGGSAPSIRSTKSQHSGGTHAFVAIRPPGHHCGEDTPSGFCFVNNVMVGAAHAHLKHGLNRIVVFDIDLHHGNGTQAIAWSLNEEAYRAETEGAEEDQGQAEPDTHETVQPDGKGADRGNLDGTPKKLKVFYGSLHDILSYPCEDGKMALVQAASVSLHGPHGQWIENIHLGQFESDDEFFDILYPRYLELIKRAEKFVEETSAKEELLVFISCGFDASLHEYPYMSRHGRRVPTSFYYRFAQDVGKFAEKYAKGRVVSVLEGGYSQRALSSGAFAHLVGLVDPPANKIDETWWGLDNLVKLELASKPKGRRSSAVAADAKWVDRALDLVSLLDIGPAKIPSAKTNLVPPGERMTLRDRKKLDQQPSFAGAGEPAKSTSSRASPKKPNSSNLKTAPAPPAPIQNEDIAGDRNAAGIPEGKSNLTAQQDAEQKKLPKVILHVKPPSASQ